MHAVMRSYSGKGAAELFDFLEKEKAEVELVIRTVPGLRSYTLIRTPSGGVSVTVCDDKAGTDASVKIAGDWIKSNAIGLTPVAPEVVEGEAILSLR